MSEFSQEYWDQLYQKGETAWDIGYPSTPLKAYVDQLPSKTISILIPGSGNSYEALYLAENGFSDITVLDISPQLTASLAEKFGEKAGSQVHIITGDFFSYEGRHDLILEQTFFCALHPSLRKAYVKKMWELLKPGGKLAGVLFNRYFEGGPPFGGSLVEYKSLFLPYFPNAYFADCYNSIKPRAGTELFFMAQKLT